VYARRFHHATMLYVQRTWRRHLSPWLCPQTGIAIIHSLRDSATRVVSLSTPLLLVAARLCLLHCTSADVGHMLCCPIISLWHFCVLSATSCCMAVFREFVVVFHLVLAPMPVLVAYVWQPHKCDPSIAYSHYVICSSDLLPLHVVWL
jgi:hypothetical protein